MVARNDLDLRGYFDNERMALLDKKHCIRLNYEAFFFADSAGADRFRSNRLAYCGLLSDPVSKRRFRPLPGAPKESHQGVDFYFESDETRQAFAQDPERFWLPGYKMNAKPKAKASESADEESESDQQGGEDKPVSSSSAMLGR